MATEHALMLEIGGPQIAKKYKAAWMMVRVHLILKRPIKHDNVLDIATWHRGVGETAAVFRDFDIFVGRHWVGEAVTSWVLADITQRKILRPGTIHGLENSPRPIAVKNILPKKIRMPREMEVALTRPLYYSDTDINGHVNNTKYADMACDALRLEQRKDRYISHAEINYVQEGFPGEVLTLYRSEEEDTQYVQGVDADGKARFVVRLKFKKV